MALQNRIGLTGFSRNFDVFVEGQACDFDSIKARTYRNPRLAQISTVTISGFDTNAEAVSVLITLPDGTVITETVTRAAGAPADDTAAAVAMAAAINARQPLNGHVEATSALGVVTLTFQHTGVEYPVSASVTGTLTATVATTQLASAGSAIPFGRFVAAGASVDRQPALRALQAGDTDDNVMGILIRPLAVIANAESPLASAVDALPLAALGAVAYEGHVAMRNNSSSATTVGGQVYAVISTTGGDELGEARMDASGVAELWTMTPTAAELDFLILVTWTRPDGVTEEVPLLSANPDGSATATEICNGWRTALTAAQADGKLAGFTGGGTATFTLSGPAGQSFSVAQVGVGVVGTVETTPAAIYAVPLNKRRFYWAEVVQPGAVGRMMVRS